MSRSNNNVHFLTSESGAARGRGVRSGPALDAPPCPGAARPWARGQGTEGSGPARVRPPRGGAWDTPLVRKSAGQCRGAGAHLPSNAWGPTCPLPREAARGGQGRGAVPCPTWVVPGAQDLPGGGRWGKRPEGRGVKLSLRLTDQGGVPVGGLLRPPVLGPLCGSVAHLPGQPRGCGPAGCLVRAAGRRAARSSENRWFQEDAYPPGASGLHPSYIFQYQPAVISAELRANLSG